MQRKYLFYITIAAGIVLFIRVATFTPTLEYDPRVTTIPAGLHAESPAQAIDELLRRSDRLPPPGTQLMVYKGKLEWKTAPKSDIQIRDVAVNRVRLSAGDSLFISLLDDDPTCRAEVDVTVSTVSGQAISLKVELWDYCLLTPWSFRHFGDGWKPLQVRWFRN